MKNKNIIKGLDKYQYKAVTSKKKNILLLAGAGSGKTYTITKKIEYLIEEKKVKQEDILCISFTNEAVESLRSRLEYKKIDVLTFHKLALKILNSKKEILSDDMLFDIVLESFNNTLLLGTYNISKIEICKLIATFINLFKSNGYELEQFYKMINKAKANEKVLLKEIMKCYICYQSYLNKENLLDFNDMINLAIKKLDSSNIRYKHIIVDEYQDISITKFNLVNKLRILSNSSFFAVGDDYQSIYRFAGSNINMITKFKKYISRSKIYKLKYTYRNSKELISVAKKFIMKNPYQINKNIKSRISIENPVIIVFYEDLNDAINTIIKENNIKEAFILARNNSDYKDINLNKKHYKMMSIHKSKGLESKYVFVVNINGKKNGFPNKYKDHEILKFVNNYKEYYKYEEERRLFYVALTRCEKKVFLFCAKNNCSCFINEIKKYKNVLIKYS